MSRGKEIVAYRTWKCKFCLEVRQDKTDMWRHLQDKHNIGSVESGSDVMMSLGRCEGREKKAAWRAFWERLGVK